MSRNNTRSVAVARHAGLRHSLQFFRVPQQISHNLSLGYSIRNGRYNISVECRNLTDEKLYDNFSLQKAGRAFYGKFRVYFEEYLSAAPIHHVGVRRFNETWESEVEREALRWAEKELGYS